MIGVFDGLFWGIVLIAIGAWFILRRYVPVSIPVIRILVAAVFIYIGIRFLIQGPAIRDRNTVVFSQSTIPYSPDRGHDYNVIFSNGTVDLTTAPATEGAQRTEVNVIFGSGVLRIDPAAPVHVSMSSVFGSVEAPDGHSVSFGDSDYRSPAWRAGSPALEIRATTVFGRLVIRPSS